MTRIGRRVFGYYGRILASVIVVLIIFFPIYWLVVASLKPLNRLYHGNSLFPGADFTLINYGEVILNEKFWLFFTNSVIVGVISTAIVIALASLGAFQ